MSSGLADSRRLVKVPEWDYDQLSLNLSYLYGHCKPLFTLACRENNIPADIANEHLINAHRVRSKSNQTEVEK